MPKILVSPVVFNEHIKVKNVIERFLQYRDKVSFVSAKLDYLVIDDGSTDPTTQIIEGYGDREVKTLRHPRRKGVGAAIRTAIDYALEHHYDILVIMAGNDKDNPEEIPIVVDPIIREGCDVVQGSRYLGQVGHGGDMPLYRKFATRLHPFFFSLITGRKLTDTTNGFRAIRLSFFKDARINLNQEWLNAYELEPYILYKAITLGYKYREAFVTKIYPPKQLGYTKMKPIVGWWSILRPLVFLRLGIKK